MLGTYLAVFITTNRWHGPPSPGSPRAGRRAGAWSHAATSLLPILENHRGSAGLPKPGRHGRDCRRSNCRGFRSYYRGPGDLIRTLAPAAVNWRGSEPPGIPEGSKLLNGLQRRASSRHCVLSGRPAAHRRRPAD